MNTEKAVMILNELISYDSEVVLGLLKAKAVPSENLLHHPFVVPRQSVDFDTDGNRVLSTSISTLDLITAIVRSEDPSVELVIKDGSISASKINVGSVNR